MNAKKFVVLLWVALLVVGCAPKPTTVVATYEVQKTQAVEFAPQPIYERPQSAAEPISRSVPQPTAAAVVAPRDVQFQDAGVNPYVDTYRDHLSTFALDVDTASYTVMRNYITQGSLPPYESVRVEEYINYFAPGYEPTNDTFAIYADGAPSPFTRGEILLRIGIQGYDVPDRERKPAALTFVIDKSGSMSQDGRMQMVKDALSALVEGMGPEDTIAVVAYDTRAYTVLEPTRATNYSEIMRVINRLQPGGTTNVDEGLQLGYQLAMRGYMPGGINRVVLCSDGVANTGLVQPEQILAQVQGYVDEGITLTTIGVGMGNYNDELLEKLADRGDGVYFYVDSNEEARRVFVDNLTSTLQVIALDAKVQVDFNPELVEEYRLVGYENRAVADQDFRNDAVDGGELGAGHTATALYVLRLVPNAEGRIATVQLRWQDPDTYEVVEINGNVNTWNLAKDFYSTDVYFQRTVIVAQFAELLRQSPYAGRTSFADLSEMADDLCRQMPRDQDTQELADLIARAARLSR
ncbi:MAG: von Willebrand factor type A domain-containing protein [Anaerolinea sp.]|nr:von Willebrand factor type A domain-containing protein [Anaerolinea sp.]